MYDGLHIMDDGWGHFSFGAAGWKTVVHALQLDIGDSILLEINSVTRANGVEFLMQIRRMDDQVHAWQPPPVPAPIPTPIPAPEQTPPPEPSDSQDESSDSAHSSDSSDSQDESTDSSGDDDDVVEVDANGNEIVDDGSSDTDYDSDYDPEEIVEVQRFGTDKVGYSFAPIICMWFVLIAGIGVFNFVKFDPTVVKTINPKYIVDYFRRNKEQAWISLGGIVLAISGTEAMFADVGHFTVRSIQISMCAVTYPSLLLAYVGQASYLRKHNGDVGDAFYRSIPIRLNLIMFNFDEAPIYWPMFVVAVMAAIIASQAMISGTFSIIQQSLSLGCFPRVQIVHTSAKYEGQVYIPEINYLLMLACVGVTLGFRTTKEIGNAYGIAVVFVMTLTSALLVLIMIMIWKTPIFLVIIYVLVVGSVELLYLSSVLYKFDQAFTAVLVTIMYVWNYVYRKKYKYELEHKVSSQALEEIAADTNLCRVPGIAIFYSELVHGITPIFQHYIANVPALHSVLIFVSVKSLPISKSFETTLVERLKEYITEDLWISSTKRVIKHSGIQNGGDNSESETDGESLPGEGMVMIDEQEKKTEVALDDIEVVDRGLREGIVHLMGESEVVAGSQNCFVKKILINYAYNFIKRNLRQTDKVFDIPHKRLLKVGMTYEL
ncbi:hypothetical protein AQUCO_00300806v1 [Aquilegia coerulea]|uniref:Potassium transporter n=1 Tax=Aquilegia coerulea TaxID=218851 RepID=A0A2G5F0M2_AQUCA|nr:hypothetical protein AQUCO_00300806v1 [Aquilegia coerulea]